MNSLEIRTAANTGTAKDPGPLPCVPGSGSEFSPRRRLGGSAGRASSVPRMFRMTVQDVFFIRNRGLVATGRVEHGELRVGDEVRINEGSAVRVDAIEAFRKKRDTAKAGDNVGLLFHRLDKGELAPGDVITSAGVFLA